MLARTVTVTNLLGLHARAAARFVHLASSFQSRVTVARGHRVVDGKSILGILLLAASRGTEIGLSVDGTDEAEAFAALSQLIESGFGETA